MFDPLKAAYNPGDSPLSWTVDGANALVPAISDVSEITSTFEEYRESCGPWNRMEEGLRKYGVLWALLY